MPQRRLFVAAPLMAAILVIVTTVLVTHRPARTPQRTTVADLTTTASPDRPLAVIGHVQPSSRHYEGHSQWRFVLEDSGNAVVVRYNGIVPSTFEDRAYVMVVGTMQGHPFAASGSASGCSNSGYAIPLAGLDPPPGRAVRSRA